VGDGRGELSGLGETGAEETGDLTEEGLGGDEGVVLAGEFLDELLVLVELLEVVNGHGLEAVVLGTIDIVLVTKNANVVSSVSIDFHRLSPGKLLLTRHSFRA